MNKIKNDEELLKTLKDNRSIKWAAKSMLEIRKYLDNRFSDYCTNNRYNSPYIKYSEGYYRVLNNIEKCPKCPYCGKDARYIGNGYKKTCCSKECLKKQVEETCLKKYGCINPSQNKEIRAKISKTCIERYGAVAFNPVKAKETCLEKYGCENPLLSEEVKEKIKRTNLKRYGSESPFGSKEVIDKCKQTRLEKYGHEYYSNWEKTKQTCLEKYGATTWLQSQDSKNRLKEKYGVDYGWQSREIWEKTRESTIEKYGAAYNKEQLNKTLQEKYGVNWFTQSEKLKALTNTPETKQKEYETKKKNHTFNSSKPENESYILLKEKFEDVVQSYRCEKYPFNCDFYIPSLDLFIECQYHWTHGNHPFNENDKNDLSIIEDWKNRNTKFYDNAINTWTIRDVNKRNIAKENDLNYIEFWNINELKEWLIKFE